MLDWYSTPDTRASYLLIRQYFIAVKLGPVLRLGPVDAGDLSDCFGVWFHVAPLEQARRDVPSRRTALS